jgi:MFS family permease
VREATVQCGLPCPTADHPLPAPRPATSLFPNGLGNQSLTVLYVVCSFSVFLAPAVVDSLGPKWAMVLGAATYVVYLVSLVNIIPAVVLSMSAVIGVGAAILWVANGVYITCDTPPAEYARATGTFWSIFQFCNIIGNLCTALVFPHLSSTSALYLGFAVVGAIGTAMLVFLGPPASALLEKADVPKVRVSFCARLSATARGAWGAAKLLAQWKMLLICPLFLLSGYELAYWTGAFPQLLQPAVIGYVLTAAGVGEVVGAQVMGKISDSVGRSASLGLGTALFAVGLAISAIMKMGASAGPMVGGAPIGAYIAALCFGVGDSCFNTNSYAMCSQLCGNKKAAVAGSEVVEKSGRASVDVEEGLLAGQVQSSAHMDADPSGSSATSDPGSLGAAGEAGGVAGGGVATDGSASVGAFTIFQLLQNIGSALGFYLGLAWPLTDQTDSFGNVTTGTLGQVWLVAAMLLASFVAFAIVDFAERKRTKSEAGRT